MFLNVHPRTIIIKFWSCDLYIKEGYSLLEVQVMCIATLTCWLLCCKIVQVKVVSLVQDTICQCHKAYEGSSPFLPHQTVCCFIIPKVNQLTLQLTTWIVSESSFFGCLSAILCVWNQDDYCYCGQVAAGS